MPIDFKEIEHGKQEKDAWEKEMEELQRYGRNVENEEHQSFENLPMIPFEARRSIHRTYLSSLISVYYSIS